MSKEVIIIGAGPGGLATAMLLASSGVSVRIIERLPFVGGRTSSIEAEGFKFDLGPTFFLYPRVLEEIFAAAGSIRNTGSCSAPAGRSMRRPIQSRWRSRSPRSRPPTPWGSASS